MGDFGRAYIQKTLNRVSQMRFNNFVFNFFVFSFLGLFSACSVVPYKDSYRPIKSKPESLKNVTINFMNSYPSEKFTKLYTVDNFKDAPIYYRYFKIPPNLEKCKLEISHEIIHDNSFFYEDFMQTMSGGTLGIVPYSIDLLFKTKITLSGESNSVTKELASDKIIMRFGLVYIPMLFVGVFSDNYRLKGQVKSKMYAYQVSSLFDELKDYKCN